MLVSSGLLRYIKYKQGGRKRKPVIMCLHNATAGTEDRKLEELWQGCAVEDARRLVGAQASPSAPRAQAALASASFCFLSLSAPFAIA